MKFLVYLNLNIIETSFLSLMLQCDVKIILLLCQYETEVGVDKLTVSMPFYVVQFVNKSTTCIHL